jgi:hypothetical protein
VLSVLAALATLAATASRAADLPAAGGLADLTGPRALGLAAATGVVAGNDGLFSNPAALAARRRYSAETLFAVDRRGGTTAGQYLGGSVVDSLSSPVTASFAYLRPLKGGQSGNYFLGGLAGPVADKLFVGAQVRYLSIRQSWPDPAGAGTTERISLVTADAGLFWEVSDLISVGFSGFNLVPTGHGRVMPRNVGGGLAVGSDTGFKLVADWRADLDRAARTTNRYAVGGELLLGRVAPIRAGYQRDETLDTSWWTMGVGLITTGGVSIDLGYKQSLKSPDARVIAVALKVQKADL